MAKKISELPASATLDGTELVEIVQAGANRKSLAGAFVPPGTLDGLKLVWVGANALTVTSGTAYVPGLGRALRVPAAIAKTALPLTASTWYHVYLYAQANGAPDVEVVAAAPAAPYEGVARAKAGDPSRRYLGSVLTDANSGLFNFAHNLGNGLISYQVNLGSAPFFVGSGLATVPTDVDCSPVVPLTATIAQTIIANNDTAAIVYIGNSLMPPSTTTFLAYIGALANNIVPLTLDGARKFQYLFKTPPTANFAARVAGYYFER